MGNCLLETEENHALYLFQSISLIHKEIFWHGQFRVMTYYNWVLGTMAVPHQPPRKERSQYSDVIMSPMASQITSLTSVYSTVYSGADQRKHQHSASLAFVRDTDEFPAQKASNAEMFPFDDVTMTSWQAMGLYVTESRKECSAQFISNCSGKLCSEHAFECRYASYYYKPQNTILCVNSY